MEFSSLIGKPLLSSSGESLGYVKAVLLVKNLSSLSALSCVDGEEEEFFVPASAVESIGDAIILGKARLKEPAGVPCPVGRAVYDENGTYLGAASALLSGENGVLTVIGACGAREFPVKSVVVGDKVMISEKRTRPKKTAQTKPRPPKKSEPPKTDYRTNLLGRQLQRAVKGLASAGETVTPEMIRRARESNKLLELTANTLT